jgi:hypothetical protein
MSLGSGSLVAVDQRLGLVLTCWHVIQDAAGPIVVAFPDGFRSAATVVRTDREWDLAALAIHRPPAQPIAISPRAPQPDEVLVLAGYGGNGEYRAVAGRCTQYLAPERNWPMELVELDAPARQGDSGGPIFNSQGELAGVLSGSGFGQTCGTYCGRVRWFLGLADAAFRRVSSQEALARQSRGEGGGQGKEGSVANVSPVTPSISAFPAQATAVPAAEPAASNARSGEPGAESGKFAKNGEGKMESGEDPKSAALYSPLSPVPSTLPSLQSPVATLPSRARTVPTASLSRNALPDQVKTMLALIGAIAVIYHGLRLLGRAVG